MLGDDEGPYDRALFERLRQVRLRPANERGLPAYIILQDSALRRIARARPSNEQELAGIKGVGAKKAADFGAEFLSVVRA